LLKKIIAFFKALNKNSKPGEIASAVCLGMILGFLPKNNLLWYILTVAFLFLRINKGGLAIFTLLFSILAPVLDPLFDNFGYWILNLSFMEKVFSGFLNIPLMSFTKINNSIVCGSLVFSLILFAPLYFLAKLFVKVWRTVLAPKIRKTKIVKVISTFPLIKKIGALGASLK
jgi:uncharacterized protein (TIGR03546 family)